MITGFITDQATTQAINDGAAKAQVDRSVPVYWLPGMYRIFTGDHAGSYFLPFNKTTTNTKLRGKETVRDLPEFDQLMTILGGEEAVQEIDPEVLKDPTTPDLST